MSKENLRTITRKGIITLEDLYLLQNEGYKLYATSYQNLQDVCMQYNLTPDLVVDVGVYDGVNIELKDVEFYDGDWIYVILDKDAI